MNINEFTQKVSDSVKEWLKDGKRIVVGIDGYSGAGKTTLLKNIAKENTTVQAVFMDDFVSTANTKEVLLPQIEENMPGLNLQWAPTDGLKKMRDVIIDFKSKGVNSGALVVEGIFLFHPDVLNDLLDKRIYLDADKEKADVRRVIREKMRFGDKYFPETHPDSFARLFKIAYKRYEELYQPDKQADLILI